MGMISDSDAFELIERMCEDDILGLSESDLLKELRSILTTNPNVVNQRVADCDDFTLLHCAVYDRSIDFCEMLVELNPDLVKIANSVRDLPLHIACSFREKSRDDIIEFLLELYPESINLPGSEGRYPIHFYLEHNDEPEPVLLQSLLKRDQGAVSKRDGYGCFPLHHVSCYCDTVYGFQLVFNSYPQAVYIENSHGETPLDIVRIRSENICGFLESQLAVVNEARQVTTPDDNGQLPLHRALHGNAASLGAIKLMVADNPASLRVVDNDGMIPLHITCQAGSVDVAEFLMEADKESLYISDQKHNFSLHLACLGGKCDIVSSVLSETTHGASLRNTDGKLPIEILLYDADCDRDSHGYVEAVYHLLCIHPDSLVELIE